MSQDLTPFTPEVWSARIQERLRKSLVALEVANTEFRAQLQKGDTIHFPYIGTLTAADYVKGTAITTQDVTPTDETLVIDTAKAIRLYIDDIDNIQNDYNAADIYNTEAAYTLSDAIDQAIMARHADFTTFDAGNVGGSAGTAITFATTNAAQVFSKVRAALRKNNVKEAGDFVAIVTPDVASVIEQLAAASGFSIADSTFRNGYAGDFLGFKVYVSNNVVNASSKNKCIFGKKGSIHAVIQKTPSLKVNNAPDGKIGTEYITWCLYGVKTFTTMKKQMLTVDIA